MLFSTALLFVGLLLGQRNEYVALSGTVVSGVAGSYTKEQGFVGAAGITLYCANGKFDGTFDQWLAVWDEDQTSGSGTNVGGFHFYNPVQLEDAISLVYQWPCDEKSDGSTPTYFSKSYKTKTVQRKDQRGTRSEVKARLLLHPTDKPFGSVDQAIATISGIVEAHSIAMRLRIPPRMREGARPAAPPRDPESAACAAIQCQTRLVFALLPESYSYNAEKMKAALSEALRTKEKNEQVSSEVAALFRRCVIENKELWAKGPDRELLDREQQSWRAFREKNPDR